MNTDDMYLETVMDKQKLQDLKRLLGMDYEVIIEYPLPRPNEDVLDTASSLMSYAHAKSVLENSDVNHILKSLNAFDSINEYNIDTYIKLSESVENGRNHFTNPNDDLPELDEVGTEIVIEFNADQYAQQNGMAQDPNVNVDGMADGGQNGPDIDMPANDVSWFEKLARKLGFKDIDMKDMLYLYLINKFNHGDDAGGDNPMSDMMQGMPKSPAMEGWVRGVERQFMVEYPENWEEKLYDAAHSKYNEGKDPVINEADDATIDDEVVDDGIVGPTMSATVKSDINNRIKELDVLIKDYEAKKHFYGEIKPAIFNAKDVLTKLLAKGTTGKMRDYKEAQLLFQKVSSPISNLFPPSVVRFLATGHDGTGAGLNKSVE